MWWMKLVGKMVWIRIALGSSSEVCTCQYEMGRSMKAPPERKKEDIATTHLQDLALQVYRL